MTWALDNDAQSTAPSAISQAQMTIPLQSSAAFGGVIGGHNAVVRIDDVGTGGTDGHFEYVLVSDNDTTTNTLTVSQRGYDGTTAGAFAAGALVTEVITSSALEGAFARIDQAQTYTEPVTFSGGMTVDAPMGIDSAVGDFNQGLSRFLGWMAAEGPPASTTESYEANDWGFDSLGALWFATGSGSPGTWQKAATGLNNFYDSGPLANAGSFSVSGIPQNGTHLLFFLTARGTNTDQFVEVLRLQLNSDSGDNYAGTAFGWSNVETGATSPAGGAYGGYNCVQEIGMVSSASATAGEFGSMVLFIPFYTSTTAIAKYAIAMSSANGKTGISGRFNTGTWEPTTAAAITALAIYGGYASALAADSRLMGYLI